jgi:hypothetical protein
VRHLLRSGEVRRELAYVALVLAFGTFFGLSHLQQRQWEPVSLERMVAGTALTPMQYRVLFPWTLRALNLFVESPGVSIHRFSQVVEIGSTILLLLVSRMLLKKAGLNHTEASWGSFLPALMLPFHYLLPAHSYYYVYDIPAVLFFALGLLLLHDRNWRYFYPLFALATLNRETSCFLALVYVLVALWRDPWRQFAVHVLAQTAIWVGIKTGLLYVYGANTSPEYADHLNLYKDSLRTNLEYLAQVGTPTLVLASVFAFCWIPVLLLADAIPSGFVKRALMVVPLFLVAMFYVGEIQELRIYGELIPIVSTASVLLVVRPASRSTRQADVPAV